MSRVEEDRQAERAAEIRAQEKRAQETKAKQRQEGASAFSKLVQQQQKEGQATQQKATQQQQQPPPSMGKSVLARLQEGKGGGDVRGQQRQTGKAESEALAQSRQGDLSQGAQETQARQGEQGVQRSRVESREADTRTAEGLLQKRSEESEQSNETAGASAQASRGKGPIKADADGGGKGGGEDGKDKKDGEVAAGFRFNPALMAPVPVAQPKPSTAASERMRAIANEIAQKIVERVRVGTNAAGAAEFQIELRGDVLSGLTIKLSAKNGKIQATFSGKDRDVLKMIEAQREGLKNALASKGLTLENMRVEAKT